MTEADLERVAIFPLPRITCFPGSQLPLYFFEPRYRALAAHVLAEDPPRIAIFQHAEPSARDAPPTLADVGTLTRVVAHRKRPDGTFDVVLLGERRVRAEELPLDEGGFRVARVIPMPDRDEARVARTDLDALRALASAIAREVRTHRPEFSLDLPDADAPPGVFADTLADRLVAAPAERQWLVETPSVPLRVERLLRILGELSGELAARRGAPS